MKLKKFLSWLLVISMLLTGGMLFVSCDDDDNDEDPDDLDENDLSPTWDGEHKKYKGSFTILTGPDGTKTSSFNVLDIESNSLGDDSISKAVRERNELIEANFGIKIKRQKEGSSTTSNDAYNKAQSAVQSKSTTYDAFMLPVSSQITLACQGGMLDLYQASYMDITADWWDNGIVEGMLLAGGAYLATGALQTTDKEASYCTVFNKKLITDGNVTVDGSLLTSDSLYALVKSGVGKTGGFTMEYLNRAAKALANPDVNGANMVDPQYTGTGNYGLYTQSEMVTVLMQAAGYTSTKVAKSSATGLKSNMDSDFISAVSDVKKVFGDVANDSWFVNLDSIQDSASDFWDTWARGSFKSGRAAFFMCHVGTINNLRDMPSDYGILPIAKINDKQTQYGNTVQYYNCKSYSVPNRDKEALNEKSAYILEAMAYYSSEDYAETQSLEYAFYTVVLRAKGTRDDNAWEMLDLVFDNRKYDLGFCANISSVASNVRNATMSPTSNAFVTIDSATFELAINSMLQTLIGSQRS